MEVGEAVRLDELHDSRAIRTRAGGLSSCAPRVHPFASLAFVRMNKKALTEADIRTKFITPALEIQRQVPRGARRHPHRRHDARLPDLRSAGSAAAERVIPVRQVRDSTKLVLGAIRRNHDQSRRRADPVSKEEREAKAKTYDYYGASGVIDKIDGYLFEKPLLLIGKTERISSAARRPSPSSRVENIG
jgi:hypothetical protein